MPFERPSLAVITERIDSDIESRLPGTDPRLRYSMLGILAKALAGSVHGLHGHLAWGANQVIPDSAEAELLEKHAAWRNVPRLAATAATGNITLTGTEGAPVPAGTALQRSDGVQYTVDAEVTISGGTATAAVTATTAGQTTNAIAATKLQLVSPLSGVQSQAVVAAGGLTGGTDVETDPELLERLRDVVQTTPQGGAAADYDTWAREVAGVTRVWVFPEWSGAGTVGVYFARDDDASPIPDAGEVATVQAYIDARRPVTADVTAYAPTAVAVAITVQLAPNTSVVQAAVTAELQDLFLRTEVEDGAGSGTVLLSHIREAISLAAGESDHILVSPAANVTLTAGQMATLGALTFQAIP